MADDSAASGAVPPGIGEALTAGWTTFKAHARILVGAFAVFAGANLVLTLLLLLIAGTLHPLLSILLSVASILPTLLLLPGLYSIALKAVRNQKAELGDLLLMFRDRFVHHTGLLLLQSCGTLVCLVGGFVTQALFIPGSFLVLDRRLDWDGAMELCVEHVKPKLVLWLLFHLALCGVVFAGLLACLVGVVITGPVALCAWAYAYDKTLSTIGRATPA